MTIQPLSDIIMDVANAADPLRAAAAKQKLAEASGGDFASLLEGASHLRAGTSWSEVSRARFFSDQTGRSLAAGDQSDEAKRGLETLIAKMLVETMLPKENAATFGHGTAGRVWRSLLADRLAEDLTRGKGLGILKNVSFDKGST
jgi:hypothetical protein